MCVCACLSASLGQKYKKVQILTQKALVLEAHAALARFQVAAGLVRHSHASLLQATAGLSETGRAGAIINVAVTVSRLVPYRQVFIFFFIKVGFFLKVGWGVQQHYRRGELFLQTFMFFFFCVSRLARALSAGAECVSVEALGGEAGGPSLWHVGQDCGV